MSKKIVTFGEIMMRLATPGHKRFVQADSFELSFGGSEANVAVSLSGFGYDACFATRLPENEWITSEVDGKVKKTIGKINEDIEISKYKTNALPLYVITDHEGNPLNNPMPTNLDIEEYKEWLDEGVRIFNER